MLLFTAVCMCDCVCMLMCSLKLLMQQQGQLKVRKHVSLIDRVKESYRVHADVRIYGGISTLENSIRRQMKDRNPKQCLHQNEDGTAATNSPPSSDSRCVFAPHID